MTAVSFMPLGQGGLGYDENGDLIVGQFPKIKMWSKHVRELPDGTEQPVGPLHPVLDMQPTKIAFADLMTAMIEANDAGKSISFRGHVVVVPTDPDARFVPVEQS